MGPLIEDALKTTQKHTIDSYHVIMVYIQGKMIILNIRNYYIRNDLWDINQKIFKLLLVINESKNNIILIGVYI